MRGGIDIARKKREWYPGAIYHAVVRGNHKEDIFMNREDYLQYLRYLGEIQEKYPFNLYSYCLMGNHIHLQIATIENEIWNIMNGINWRYSRYFNRKYDKVGHLFQDRYYSEIIETESYLLQTSKYIHLNPVKACIVDKPIQYPWSSYGIFMGVRKSSLVNEKNILMYFEDSRELYKEYVENETVPGTVDVSNR